MSLTKSRAAITTLTASGPSTPLDISGAYSATLLWSHSNGSGAVTAAASFAVQVMSEGGSTWITHCIPVASTATGATDGDTIPLPPDVASVRVVYTAPTGPTGFTLDVEVAITTSY